MATITTLDELLGLYGEPPPGAITKERTEIGAHYRALLEAAPFCALATVGGEHVDCTPRGDDPGFVRVVDEHTLEMPDRRGNNRLDSLRNILEDPRVALLFLIPRRNETMRVTGRASITTDPATLARHAVGDKEPTTVIRVAVERAYYQCGKALMRSHLWQPDEWPAIDHLPTTGTISASFNEGVDAADYDATLEARLRDSMY